MGDLEDTCSGDGGSLDKLNFRCLPAISSETINSFCANYSRGDQHEFYKWTREVELAARDENPILYGFIRDYIDDNIKSRKYRDDCFMTFLFTYYLLNKQLEADRLKKEILEKK